MRTPEQKYAVYLVNKAIRKGELIRPDSCECCGIVPSPSKDGRVKIQGHHHKGYAPEHVLDVEWLCPSCHKIKHPNDQEALDKIASANTGRVRSEESRKKQSITVSGYTGERKGWTEERRIAQSERMKRYWTPERRDKQSDRAIRDQPWLGAR